MKIIFVLPAMNAGGVEHIRLVLAEKLIASGIECQFALRRYRGTWLERARKLARVHELAPHGLHQFIPALAALLRRERPTHLITAFPDVGVLAWCAIHLSRQHPVWIHSVHGTHSLTARRAGVSGRWRHGVDIKFARTVYKHADRIITISDGLRNEVIRQFGIDPQRVERIYNPVVPETELRPRAVDGGTGSEPCQIAAIGRLSKEKGFDVLVTAMRNVKPPWGLRIFGEGPERLNLQKLISSNGLLDRIQLAGYTDRPFDVLRSSDLFVLPSRHEGFGNALVEALASQCQVVATDCPVGPTEILQGGQLGQLVPSEDPDALAEAIGRSILHEFHVPPSRLLKRATEFSALKGVEQWRTMLETAATNR